MIRIHERVGWSKKIYRRWPVTFSPRSPSDPARLRVITRGSKRHFSSAQYFFLTRLLLIHTAYSPSPSLSISPSLVRFSPSSSPSLLPPSLSLGKSGREREGVLCSLPRLDAILISNSEKITLPSEPFKGLLRWDCPCYLSAGLTYTILCSEIGFSWKLFSFRLISFSVIVLSQWKSMYNEQLPPLIDIRKYLVSLNSFFLARDSDSSKTNINPPPHRMEQYFSNRRNNFASLYKQISSSRFCHADFFEEREGEREILRTCDFVKMSHPFSEKNVITRRNDCTPRLIIIVTITTLLPHT